MVPTQVEWTRQHVYTQDNKGRVSLPSINLATSPNGQERRRMVGPGLLSVQNGARLTLQGDLRLTSSPPTGNSAKQPRCRRRVGQSLPAASPRSIVTNPKKRRNWSHHNALKRAHRADGPAPGVRTHRFYTTRLTGGAEWIIKSLSAGQILGW